MADPDFHVHRLDSTVFSSALCHAAYTWADTAATSKTLRTINGALEGCLRYNRRDQHQVGFRSSDLRQTSRLRDPAEYVSKVEHKWAGLIMGRKGDRCTKGTLRNGSQEKRNDLDRDVPMSENDIKSNK
ncbi:hypothetical protein Y032_0106g3731 [Ancylostoma ceylanicum]|uniref:Uncharacterized protein n=1 Tax=Ancylostoma ceylanicum TaxID=53326 RepID=A0A016TFS3_9BILA|nr:hypothetical protein Y032_0106g3731 [Ancylostoma ceylanicum]